MSHKAIDLNAHVTQPQRLPPLPLHLSPEVYSHKRSFFRFSVCCRLCRIATPTNPLPPFPTPHLRCLRVGVACMYTVLVASLHSPIPNVRGSVSGLLLFLTGCFYSCKLYESSLGQGRLSCVCLVALFHLVSLTLSLFSVTLSLSVCLSFCLGEIEEAGVFLVCLPMYASYTAPSPPFTFPAVAMEGVSSLSLSFSTIPLTSAIARWKTQKATARAEEKGKQRTQKASQRSGVCVCVGDVELRRVVRERETPQLSLVRLSASELSRSHMGGGRWHAA